MRHLHRRLVVGQLGQREFAQRPHRELARAFTREGLDLHHAARHEHRLQPLPQCSNDVRRRQRGRDHERHRPHHAVGHLVGQPEGTVLDTRDAVQVVVQVGERTAPAGDVDQVVGTAEQAKAPCIEQLEHVGHRRRLGNEIAAEDEALGTVTLPRFRMHADLAEGFPDFALGRAARGHLARFGAAVDFEQHAAQCLLGLQGQLRRQRRGG
ncbi:hypothetical protein D9M69_567120 [compost metagenome]